MAAARCESSPPFFAVTGFSGVFSAAFSAGFFSVFAAGFTASGAGFSGAFSATISTGLSTDFSEAATAGFSAAVAGAALAAGTSAGFAASDLGLKGGACSWPGMRICTSCTGACGAGSMTMGNTTAARTDRAIAPTRRRRARFLSGNWASASGIDIRGVP